jgi:SAM-dependent methyltransferase
MRPIDFERHFASRYTLEADDTDPVDGHRVLRGRLVPFDAAKRLVEIKNGVPRFVSSDNYADNFGLQWNTFRSTQLDSHSGLNLSAKRLWENTRWRPDQVAGKTVLEVGSGAGRFTEILLAAGATVVSIDYSSAVESNFANNAKRGDVLVAQADLYELPFADESFDFVLCYGVLQHTPDAALAYKKIFDKLRPGGKISIDHYRKFRLPNVWSTPKYIWRHFVKRMPPENLLRLVRGYLRWWFPVDNLIRNVPFGKALLSVVPLPCWNYVGSGLTYAQRKEWAVLDTFDALSAKYDNPLTLKQVEDLVRSEKNAVTEVFFGGTGIVANTEKGVSKPSAATASLTYA